MTFALVQDGKVISCIVWDGPDASPMTFDEGITAIEITESQPVGVGYTYSDGEFKPPELTKEEVQQQKQQMMTNNAGQKDSLMSEASSKIAVLQDAVDLEIATDEEAIALPLWKKYRVILSRINPGTTDKINWPDKPAT
ncbi:tail fiber assembly protein [Pantoea agglomerans]|uniref:tail fiber assembly protein n=1 Tax=Enterobacter agglomerans TaxID=549 RepID=UPI0028980EDC|nr:tail fiber assembly protein [Pantoea agglomerans]WNK73186.1 tail fiber assembly protein [Pantoea agglomerans]